GEPAATYYSRNCAGTTEEGERVWPGIAAPYLRSHPDPYCVVHGRSEWSAEIGKHDLAAALREAGDAPAAASIVSLRIVERTPSGRVARIEIRGATTQVITGERFRTALARVLGAAGLRSNAFDVSDAGDRFIFHGYGAGHGAGLCQAGAEEMGAEGKTYREILAFYYPGTVPGLTAQGLEWVRLGGEGFDMLTTRPDADRALVARAERALRDAESRTGWQPAVRPELRVYPTVSVYRNATGQPGSVAASTRGHTIRLEPAEVLNAAGVLDSTLRHEFLHLLIEGRARPGLPLWFREGLALYLNGEAAASPDAGPAAGPVDLAALDRTLANPALSAAEQRAAYRRASAAVARLVKERGRAEVLSWVERGLPPEVVPPGQPR
ncbi:MAG TPA: SpoIID/LytB domain-containing protein, partial [Candidatus Acidoferrales bacterium]|nr:SpoIID/LytB domain-containing protein [Candidatus Acidoferrales bacterium]